MAKETVQVERVAWPLKEWRLALGISHTQTYEWIKDGTLPTAKLGGARRILESPRAFAERHRDVRSAAVK